VVTRIRLRERVGIFTVVGILGYGVQTAVLWLLVGRLGMAVVPAT
jgi:putative flippase GtrA